MAPSITFSYHLTVIQQQWRKSWQEERKKEQVDNRSSGNLAEQSRHQYSLCSVGSPFQLNIQIIHRSFFIGERGHTATAPFVCFCVSLQAVRLVTVLLAARGKTLSLLRPLFFRFSVWCLHFTCSLPCGKPADVSKATTMLLLADKCV
jgi:hypothetical protein